ncbi:hypothetical protein E7T06_15285 [Deinococcus sp. Arct2-2]|uniref:hypothetical protein n=1 Tax=Deinococcus sp. Arct2-2 TaxID=2568653 RepID=UPI0010A4BC8E|nr:hypothetical protein [Deinococcus sp. Arct2-2]THF68725.1 hypothetical protein E7T06_15285 [Deinococcus sp. Arct2-2]
MSEVIFARSSRLARSRSVRPALALLTLGSLVPLAAAQVQTQSIVVNPTVLSLTLIDADTNRPVPGYDPIAPNATLDLSKLPPRLNVRANTAGKVGSVRFGLDGQGNFRTESTGPYALCGNSGGDFSACAPNVLAPGNRQLSVTTYASGNGNGAAGPTVRVNLTVVKAAAPALAVTSLTLINADTDRPVPGYDPIPAGARLKLSALPRNLNVRANVSAGVGSVRFVRDGKTVLENEAPFALCVDGRDSSGKKGNYYACGGTVFAPGDHRLTATPFSKLFAGGTAGTALTWNYSVDK